VLAGELARHGDDIAAALRAYEVTMRPFVAEAQKLIPGTPGLLYPSSQLGITLLHKSVGLVTWLGIDKLVTRLLPENKGGWNPPDYPELNLGS